MTIVIPSKRQRDSTPNGGEHCAPPGGPHNICYRHSDGTCDSCRKRGDFPLLPKFTSSERYRSGDRTVILVKEYATPSKLIGMNVLIDGDLRHVVNAQEWGFEQLALTVRECRPGEIRFTIPSGPASPCPMCGK